MWCSCAVLARAQSKLAARAKDVAQSAAADMARTAPSAFMRDACMARIVQQAQTSQVSHYTILGASVADEPGTSAEYLRRPAEIP